MRALIAVNDSAWATELAIILNPMGYESTKSTSSDETLGLIKDQVIDLIICDTTVDREDTINLLQRIPDLRCAIIFITESPSESSYARTTQFKQSRFLVKPFHQLTLRSVIDSLTTTRTPASGLKGIKVRSATGQRLLLSFDKILWLSADKNHCFIHTHQNHFILKQSLIKLSQQLDWRFAQVHKSYWINIDHVTHVSFGRRQVSINEEIIPIGRTYKDQLAERLLDNPNIRL